MKKIAFIPSREDLPPSKLTSSLQSAGWEVCLLSGYSNIFEAFKKGIDLHNITAEDRVILCHDDIEILTDAKYFNKFIEDKLSLKDTGFVGVAGTCMLKHSGVWWEGVNQPLSPTNALAGIVYHGSPGNMRETYYGTCQRVAVMDGLFLATTGKVLHSIALNKPSYFKGDWDFYDIFYTSQAFIKGLKNYVVPIHVVHNSPGEIKDKEGWHLNREAFVRKFDAHLPLVVK
tara:strand:- start:206 stop:895 length:690 start_codon:yes stop_codon:yes gene_type:complete